MMDSCSPEAPSPMDIKRCLSQFQARRRLRASEVVRETNANVRALTFRTPILKFAVRYISPMLGDIQANTVTDRYISAEKVEFLPVPARSVTGTMLFNPTQGIAQYDNRMRRVLFALPLLVLALFSPSLTKQSPMPILQILEMPTYVVWLVEGNRRANFLKPIQW